MYKRQVLTAGRGSSGGATLWQNGFLPSNYAGVQFRNGDSPLLNLKNPNGIPNKLQKSGLETLRKLNEKHFSKTLDPEILSRIENYELAFRMQSAAPELVDLSNETTKTLENYGVNRQLPKEGGGRGKEMEILTRTFQETAYWPEEWSNVEFVL